jgi:drug/metabolite transporter (DMT)-like permease
LALANMWMGTLWVVVYMAPTWDVQLTWRQAWLLGVSGVLWTLVLRLDLAAYGELDVGVNGLLNSLRMVFLQIAGVMVFAESMSTPALLGAGVVVLSSAFGVGIGRSGLDRGLVCRMLCIVCGTLALTLDKYLLDELPIWLVLVSGYGLPSLFLVARRPGLLQEVVRTHRLHAPWVWASSLLYAIDGICLLMACGEGSLWLTMLIYELKVVFALPLGWLFLRERDNLSRRALGAMGCVLGVALASFP